MGVVVGDPGWAARGDRLGDVVHDLFGPNQIDLDAQGRDALARSPRLAKRRAALAPALDWGRGAVHVQYVAKIVQLEPN